MSRLDNDNASSSSFSAWMQEVDVRQTLSTTMEALNLPTIKFSSRSLRLLDSSATALWNAFMRFLRRVELGEIGGEVAQGTQL